ncbi:MAG: DUF1499 domain-containing protein [Gemmatimonadota bacterium]
MTLGKASAGRDGGARRIAGALAWIGLCLAAACSLAALGAGPGYRLGTWGLGAGFRILSWSTGLALLAALVSLVAMTLSIRAGARRFVAIGVAGLAIGIATAGPPLYLYREATRLPKIHDISTDTENPPQFVAVLPLRKGAPNSVDYSATVAEQQKRAYPDIAPLLLDVPPAQAFAQAERVAREMGWDIVAAAPQDLRIEATATTLMFGFKDDVVIRIAPHGAGSRLDIRSVSRLGSSDIGTNAKRIRTFVAKMKVLQSPA